ncbi:type II toxin-antitoxin system VapC family toxin [Meiothermus granaticius]|uniref:tRNA(fMet)-specific endonuclease VapC n=1 Tax=Meiothermus granaticius NBRC 107808 TaxID=1227551 RepID=A0A399F949_9DEIN|nr:PIN domain-containing protein [Meiothermus granaticius]RIH91161.1 tRNA(fMet)-specific endonuclease VapC [Meiothermus granaticius NBRC 107808]GEM88361.1 twitching motility protein PilT [Meiothermus granaticius NBRC 107808]
MSTSPHRLVLDAGPLIALFHAGDPDHEAAVRGFQELAQQDSRLITPLPVLFEVYKWLLFEGGPAVARRALERMLEALEVVPIGYSDLEASQVLLVGRPDWRGTLEDASVVLLALRAKAPVWTLNYRDLGVFKELSFWAG